MKKSIFLFSFIAALFFTFGGCNDPGDEGILEKGDFNINAGIVVISTDGNYRISGNGTPTGNTIQVDAGVTADIILENVNIDMGGVAFSLLANATVTLRLSGENTLKSGNDYAGLHVPAGATLTITSTSGDKSTEGTLNVTGGSTGVRIGNGYKDDNSGTITISGGTINAIGSYGGSSGGNAGIRNYNGIITISGGTVNATDGGGGDGIYNREGTINISGGTVNATGGGDGIYNREGTINISGGTVNATGGGGGDGIYNREGTINISGGTVNATGGGDGIYISGDINISGGTGRATGNGNHAGIEGETVNITGGSIIATVNIIGGNNAVEEP